MLEIFDENNYGFTDSLLGEIKLDDQNISDYLIAIDYYIGKEGYSPLTLRLKNVKKLKVSINKKTETHLISLLTLAHISKKRKGKSVELIVESAHYFFGEDKSNEPLICCTCEEVYVEK